MSKFKLIYYTPGVDFDDPESVATCRREKFWDFTSSRKLGAVTMRKEDQLKVTLAFKSVIARGGEVTFSGFC